MKPNTILVIDDDDEIREVLVLLIKLSVEAHVIEAANTKSALEIISSTPHISCVVSDYDLGDGTCYEVFQLLKSKNTNTPFILCSGSNMGDRKFNRDDKLSAVISKPFRSEEVVKAIRTALNSPEVSQPLTAQYFPVKIETLAKMGVLDCDLYIKLSEEKYIKLASFGQDFEQGDYKKYHAKGVEYLYLDTSQSPRFITTYIQDVISLNHAQSLDNSSAVQLTEEAHEILHKLVSLLGVTDETVALAKSCSSLAIANILSEPTLTAYADTIKFNRNNYLSAHSMVLAQVCCIVASMMGYSSQTSQYKLAFAALVHDLAFPDDITATLELFVWLDATTPEATQESIKAIMNHPAQAVALLMKMRTFPAEVDQIIKTHHERPDGKGFPDNLDSGHLSPMQGIFIIAHDLTNYIWLQEKEIKLDLFIIGHQEEYNQGVFKKFLDCCPSHKY